MRALVTALESDLAAVRRELAETQSQAEETQSQLESQFRHLQAEKESLISKLAEARNKTNEVKPREDALNEPATVPKSKLDASRHKLERADRLEKDAKSKSSSGVSAAQTQIETRLSNGGQKKAAVVPVEEKAVSSMEAAAEADEKMDVRIEGDQIQPLVAEAEAPGSADIALEEVEATDLPNASEKVIFTKALSDITSEDTAVRIDAVKIIAGVRHELSVRALAAQMAHETSTQVRQECVKALMTLQMAEGLPAVERALTDRAASVRLAAVWGLYRLAGAESAPALIRMFSDEDEDVRRRAATYIGWLGKEELAVELVPLLDDRSISVRGAAVEAMGNLRCRQVVWPLIEHLNDPDESVRKAVLSALKIITGKKMSGPFPKNAKSLERLIARWQEWWKEQCAE